MNAARWLGALDALAPYLIAVAAVAIARHAFATTRPATIAAVVAIILLGLGSVSSLFLHTTDAHLTWPVAFVLFVVFVPLLALHVRIESDALAAPVAIHLLPLAFTWSGLFIATCLIIGVVCMMGAEHPGWAGVAIVPLAVLLAAPPVLSLNPSRPATLTAVLYIFALAEIVSGVAWLMPERRRWFVIPAVLIVAAFVIGRAFFATPHHPPGWVLLLVDTGLALFAAAASLASPLICRWLIGAAGTRTSRQG